MVTVEGYGKINLTLDILGMRSDGFHEVAMVMQSLALSDTLHMERTAGKISLVHDREGLESDERNLAWRAAALVKERYGIKGGAKIRLKKRIPIAAGLAGGSADAAAALRAMTRLYEIDATEEELCALGAELGSDIPFSLMGGTMLATGRGELLRSLPAVPHFYVVLAKPPISISTPWAYRTYDEKGTDRHPDNAAMEAALQAKDPRAIARLLCNALERVSIGEHPVIQGYKDRMLGAGALAAMMSGSGPTVFALSETREQAEKIRDAFADTRGAEVYLTETRGPVQ